MARFFSSRHVWHLRQVFFAALTAFIGFSAHAAVTIDINRGKVEPTPIALLFSGSLPEENAVANDLVGVIAADLERSGLFSPLDPQSFIQQVAHIDDPPRFEDWRVINAQVLVQGVVEAHSQGMFRVSFRVWDVFAGQHLVGKAFTVDREHWRRVAHISADEIYKRLTGETGYFDTRVVYVAESGPAIKRVKRLAVMDQDGARHQYLTDGSFMALTPRFSPTAHEITYMSFYNDDPRVFLLNVDSGRQEVLGDFPGMTFAPRFSPDGNRVVLSMAKSGNTDVFSMNLRTRQRVRLTRSPGIDTSPCFSPDGRKIAFNSDRGGSQQLYVMNAEGGGVRRISFGNGRYATPVWSPRGDLIAFTKIKGGRFYIGVMKPDGTGERLLASGFLVESPTWAPNGRVLMYYKSRRGQEPRLYSVDLTGSNERSIPTPQSASDPAWSPLLP